MGKNEVEAFLTDLAVRCGVAASSQNQALAALLFLYREVLGIELPWLENIRRAKRPERLPTVLSNAKVQTLPARTSGPRGCWLACCTAADCTSSKACDCACRTLISIVVNSWVVAIASRQCRI